MLTTYQIKQILKQEQLSISKYRGQNFLVDSNIKDRIISALDLKSGENVLEIGPGLGALTDDLAVSGAFITAVEKDKGLYRVLKQRLSASQNLNLIHEDILNYKLSGKKIKVIGNLPYYISTPIVCFLLEENRNKLTDIFVTVQYEVGKRLAAEKNTKDYSSISVFTRYFTRPEILFTIPKKAFYPQPKVDSVFLRLELREKPAVQVDDERQFFKIVRKCFGQRRKTILNSLTHKLNKGQKQAVQECLQGVIDLQSRPENLSLSDFARIANHLEGGQASFKGIIDF